MMTMIVVAKGSRIAPVALRSASKACRAMILCPKRLSKNGGSTGNRFHCDIVDMMVLQCRVEGGRERSVYLIGRGLDYEVRLDIRAQLSMIRLILVTLKIGRNGHPLMDTRLPQTHIR